MAEGIQSRHRSGCSTRNGQRPLQLSSLLPWHGLRPSNQTPRRGPWTSDKGTAVKWRTDAMRELASGVAFEPSTDKTLNAAWETSIAEAEAGHITPRNSSDPYKTSSLASYRPAWTRVRPKFGARMLSSITYRELQDWADEMRDKEMARATIAGIFDPIRALYARAKEDDERVRDPVGQLHLPQRSRKEIVIVEPPRVGKLLAALPDEQRALWATAFCTGLRRSKLRALRVSDLHFDQGVIILSRAWTCPERIPRESKSKAGTRRVPVEGCEAELKAHIEREGRSGDDLVFSSSRDTPSRLIPRPSKGRPSPRGRTRNWSRSAPRLPSQLRVVVHRGRARRQDSLDLYASCDSGDHAGSLHEAIRGRGA